MAKIGRLFRFYTFCLRPQGSRSKTKRSIRAYGLNTARRDSTTQSVELSQSTQLSDQKSIRAFEDPANFEMAFDLLVQIIGTIFGVFDFIYKVVRVIWEALKPAPNLRNLQGKRVLIVGGGGGVGSAVARKLADEGVEIALWDNDELKLKSLSKELKESGYDVITQVVDICHAKEVSNAADQLAKNHNFEVEILFNTAGYCHLYDSLHDSDERIERVLDTNLKGVVWCSRVYWKQFLQKRKGHIISMASVAGIAPVPHLNEYTATLHGVVGYMDVLEADTYARVNTPMANTLKTTGNARWPWLEATQVAEKVVYAMRTHERTLTFPAEAALFCSLKSILPTRRFNLLNGRWWNYET
ncbi:17-beta-hydroxysteroid dehydrogenase 13 [Aphelenchoides besseyi]|nr:17-beta-hydroxysteroid dehydrogenase 13 [Aphelenchoides besseyi]